MAPTTRLKKNKDKQKISASTTKPSCFVHLDSEFLFVQAAAQLYFTNITETRTFSLAEIIGAIKTQLLFLLVEGNPLLIRLPQEVQRYFKTDIEYFHNSDWLNHIHKVIRPVDKTLTQPFFVTNGMKILGDLTTHHVIKTIKCRKDTPVNCNENLLHFMRNAVQHNVPFINVLDVKCAIQRYITNNRAELSYEHNPDILLLTGSPLRSLYLTEAIHISQVDNIYFNCQILSLCQTISVSIV